METSRTIMALFLIIGLTIMGLLVSGCEKLKQAEAPKQDATPSPQSVQQPASQVPGPPPAQLGKGSTDCSLSNGCSNRSQAEHAAGDELSEAARL